MLWMTGALLSFSAMAVSIRELSRTLSVFEMLTIRSAAGLAILLAVVAVRPDLRAGLRTHKFALHLVRNAIHYAAQYAWATAITLLPLATVFALEFTAPAWGALLAALFLAERLTPSRIGAVVLGFLGVLIIVRPGIASFHPAALAVLAAAVGYAAASVATKKLTATDSTFTIVFWMNLLQLPMSLAGADPAFVTRLGLPQLLPILALAVSGLSAHYCLTNAFRAGDASTVMPFDFLRIPLIALIGRWLYGEPLELAVFAGAALIISGISWNLHAETRQAPVRPPGGVGKSPW
jgi:drug/metabolite transporter (DMT)-like permease